MELVKIGEEMEIQGKTVVLWFELMEGRGPRIGK